MSDVNKKLMKAFESINKQMEAHLIESIISLFNQGVLKHYIREPRQTIDERNFKMTIQAANGVTFEGREKLVELEEKIKSIKAELEKVKEENLRMRNKSNCSKFSIDCGFINGEKCPCGKWELRSVRIINWKSIPYKQI